MNDTKLSNLNLSEKEIIDRAISFHKKGNILKAIEYYKYCVDMEFNNPEVFNNFGLIFKNNGKLLEAENLVRKAIELEPDNINANNNLSLILKDLGKVDEALRFAKKVIRLNPDLAEAHHNIGIIFKDLGKLKEAENSSRKAIELKFDLIDAHYNLTTILMDLGKLEEVITLTQSTLKLKEISLGNKLIASLMTTIAYLLIGDFSKTLLNLNQINYLINEGAINSIKNKKTKNHVFTFTKFISLLLPKLDKSSAILNKIPHIGESHCLSFSHQILSISSKKEKIQPVLITGAKAWHFANKKDNQWKDSFKQQIKNHTYSDNVFISFGEIDCRKDQGILTYVIKNNKNIFEVCKKTINNYLNFMEENLASNYPRRYYFGIPAPFIEHKLRDELDLTRIEIVKIFNEILIKEVLSRGSFFLDVYGLTSNIDGENNKIYMCDNIHLSPTSLDILFKSHLYKP